MAAYLDSCPSTQSFTKKKIQFLPYGRSIGSWICLTHKTYTCHTVQCCACRLYSVYWNESTLYNFQTSNYVQQRKTYTRKAATVHLNCSTVPCNKFCARIAAAVWRKRRDVICEMRGTRPWYTVPSCKTYPCQHLRKNSISISMYRKRYCFVQGRAPIHFTGVDGNEWYWRYAQVTVQVSQKVHSIPAGSSII
jgi:hypothetical protein